MGEYTDPSQRKSRNAKWIVAAVILVVIAAAAVAGMALRGNAAVVEAPAVLADNRQIDVQKAYGLYKQGVFVLDVRTPEEYQAGHIPGATLIPLDQLAQRTDELPVDEPILIYCRTGSRSLQAMNLLGNDGFRGLSSMDGGITAWEDAGYPLE